MNFWDPNVPLFTSTSQSVFFCGITEILQYVHIFCVKGELEREREKKVRARVWCGGRFGEDGKREIPWIERVENVELGQIKQVSLKQDFSL